MKRAALMIVVSLVGVGESRGERYILFSGSASFSAATYHLGMAPLGASSVTAVLSASVPLDATGETIRNQMMPANGIAGFGKRGADAVSFDRGIIVFHPETTQFFVSTDGSNWTVIPKNEQVVINGGTFFRDAGSNGPVEAVGAVPVVSTWGLLIFATLVVTAGAIVMRRRLA